MPDHNLALSTPALTPLPPVADKRGFPRLAGLFSLVVSLALFIAVADQFRQMSLQRVFGLVPHSAPFWLAFVVFYLATPLSEWIIYRKLWQIPPDGFAALMRKLVSNELLLGYLGEAQFYVWARKRLNLATAPFGTIKDVSVLSALTGNIATVVMLAIAWPLISSGAVRMDLHSVFLSLGVVVASSFAILLLRGQLFSLGKRDLAFIAAMHLLRIAATVGLSAVMWNQVMPLVGVDTWLVLATLRLLVSRLPLVPNKDVVFVGFAMVLLGRDADVTMMLTMLAGLVLAAHVCSALVFGVSGLFGDFRRQD